MTPWPKFPLVFEINTRVWLRELSERLGYAITLANVPDSEIEALAALGFDAVWLMGVWTTGNQPLEIARTHPGLQEEYKRALPDYTEDDCIGSPYAVTAYEVARELGGSDALAGYRQKLAGHGLRLMLDFVCNHTARDNTLVNDYPKAFVQGATPELRTLPECFFRNRHGVVIAHARDPFFPPWTDTAQINYAQAAGRALMLRELERISAQCDGVRCDMAMLILPEIFGRTWSDHLGQDPDRVSFWRETIPAIRRLHPGFLFLAEGYWDAEWQLQQEGFDYTYDKKLYDRLVLRDCAGVRSHLRAEPAFRDRCAHFIENHDEPRAAAEFGALPSQSAAVVSFFAPGLRLFHEGQMDGMRVKLPVQLRRRPTEHPDAGTRAFYEVLLRVLANPIFKSGVFSQVQVNAAGAEDATAEKLVALRWTPERASPQKGFLIVANLSDGRALGRVPLDEREFCSGARYLFQDRMNDQVYERNGSELRDPGLYVALEGFQSHIFEILPRATTHMNLARL